MASSPKARGVTKPLRGARADLGSRDSVILDASTDDAARPAAVIFRRRPDVCPRAFEMLAAQPVSLAGLTPAERDLVIVTAVADAHGNEYPVSRLGDRIWNMASELKAKNTAPTFRRIVWPGDDVPKALVDDAKAALYYALRNGRHGGRWSGSSVLRTGREAINTLRYLASRGLCNFSEVRALYLSDYIEDLQSSIKPQSIKNRLTIVDLVWSFPQEMFHPLLQHPWGGGALHEACGCKGADVDQADRSAKTPVIPRSVQSLLFDHCEHVLGKAEALFLARDAGRITASSYELTPLRDAALYLTQVTSGMRNSESTGITSNSWRTEVKNNVSFHWVHTREIKTGKGEVDYLVPPQVAQVLEILRRYAEPLQARLADEARWLEQQLHAKADEARLLPNGMTIAEAVERLNHVREVRLHLFLGVNTSRSDHLGTGSRVDVLSVNSCNSQLKALARAAGADWNLANHQCRRTFAYNVANSRLGRIGLVFLKWQLKHSSMSWTQLYASNPRQDQSLYREMEDEQSEARVALMEGWLQSEAPLSGGAGRRLLRMRATPVRDLQKLLRRTADAIEIRSTGHAWCLSGTRSCHGQGVYDASRCASCSQAIIDRDQVTAWQMIHLDNLRLAAITDCGPAVAQKAARAIRSSEQVLNDLGVTVPSKEQSHAYEAAKGIA